MRYCETFHLPLACEISVFSPGYFEWIMGVGQEVGQGGGRNVYVETTNLLLCSALTLFYSSPLGKEVK